MKRFEEPRKIAPDFYFPRSHRARSGATPSIDGTNLWVSSREGQFFCFERATGKIRWSKDFVEDYDLEREKFDDFVSREKWRLEKTFERLLDTRFAATALMSEAEWDAVYELAIRKASGEE